MSAESKFKITTEIRGILLDEPKLTSIVGEKIFPIKAPKDTPGDFILYQRDEYSKEYNKMAITSQTCKVFVTAISEDYDKSQELAYQINECLEGVFDDPDMAIKLIDSTEDYEDGKFIQVLLFEIQ